MDFLGSLQLYGVEKRGHFSRMRRNRSWPKPIGQAQGNTAAPSPPTNNKPQPVTALVTLLLRKHHGTVMPTQVLSIPNIQGILLSPCSSKAPKASEAPNEVQTCGREDQWSLLYFSHPPFPIREDKRAGLRVRTIQRNTRKHNPDERPPARPQPNTQQRQRRPRGPGAGGPVLLHVVQRGPLCCVCAATRSPPKAWWRWGP